MRVAYSNGIARPSDSADGLHRKQAEQVQIQRILGTPSNLRMQADRLRRARSSLF
jgi:hypothetical protein